MRVKLGFFLWAILSLSTVRGEFSFSYYPVEGNPIGSTSNTNSFFDEVVEKFLSSGEVALRKISPKRVAKTFPFIYFPTFNRDSLLEIFEIPSRSVHGEAWIGLFKGRLVPQESGRFRFVGLGEDVLMVRVNRKAVLDARGEFYPPEDYKPRIEYLSVGAGKKNRNLRAGVWVNLTKGIPIDLEVLIGGEGDETSFYLMIENEDDISKEGGKNKNKLSLVSFKKDIDADSLMRAGSQSHNPPFDDIAVFVKDRGFATFDTPRNDGVSPMNQVQTMPLDKESEEATSEIAGTMDKTVSGADDRWSGDFHIQDGEVKSFRSVLTLWYRSGDRSDKWSFQIAEIPKTRGQQKATSRFFSGETELPQKIVEERGRGGSKQRVVHAEHKIDPRKTNELFNIKLVYETEILSHRLVKGKGDQSVEKLSSAERKKFLSVEYPFDFDRKPVQKWIVENDLIRKKGERDLAFASRVQSLMVSYFKYNADRRMSVEDALRFRGIACGESALLFGGIMRMNGIPARVRPGRWAGTQEKSEEGVEDMKVHVKVDFYAEGVGWVVVEFPYGEKDQQKIDDCIGRENGFITMQIDPFVTRDGRFIFDQGFRAYKKGVGQPYAHEWWETEVIEE